MQIWVLIQPREFFGLDKERVLKTDKMKKSSKHALKKKKFKKL